MMSGEARNILILGASRGLGLGLAKEFLSRGWQVTATARGRSAALAALAEAYADTCRVETLDITDADQAMTLRKALTGTTLDVLFVNAGVVDDKRPAARVTTDEFTRVMITNALSPMRMIDTFASLVQPGGVIGVMSSGLGSVTNNSSGGWDVYRASKAALNTLLRSRAAQTPNGPAYLAIAPGWVRTDMGGPSASLDVETSMRGVTEVLTSRLGTSGCAFLDYKGTAVPW